MGYKYSGPNFEVLPESIRERIREAARIAENETGALGVCVTDLNEFPGSVVANEIWEQHDRKREVFVYDFGSLHDAYFREGDSHFKLSFCGMSSDEDMVKIERALGLEVKQRPSDNQSQVDIRIKGKPLTKIEDLGHVPNAQKETPFAYQVTPSGPYVGLNGLE
jgi:hypothetical protein